MAISDAIAEYLEETHTSQQELASRCYVDRTLISRVKNGQRKFPKSAYRHLSKTSVKLLMATLDEASGGYVTNFIGKSDAVLNASAQKEILMKDLDELIKALGEIVLAKHPDDRSREKAIRLDMELRDVVNRGLAMIYTIEEMYGLDHEQMTKRYEEELKRGER